jgi:hypothetical protein
MLSRLIEELSLQCTHVSTHHIVLRTAQSTREMKRLGKRIKLHYYYYQNINYNDY